VKLTNENIEAATKCLREIIDCPFEDFNTTAKIQACKVLSEMEFARLYLILSLEKTKIDTEVSDMIEKAGFTLKGGTL